MGLYDSRLVVLLDQIAIIISPWSVCHFNNKAFDMVEIFLISWREQQKHLLPMSLPAFNTQIHQLIVPKCFWEIWGEQDWGRRFYDAGN